MMNKGSAKYSAASFSSTVIYLVAIHTNKDDGRDSAVLCQNIFIPSLQWQHVANDLSWKMVNENPASRMGGSKDIFKHTANLYLFYCYIFTSFLRFCFSHPAWCISVCILLYFREEQSSPNKPQTHLNSALMGLWHHHRHNIILTIFRSGKVTSHAWQARHIGFHPFSPFLSCFLHPPCVSVSVSLSLPFLPSISPSSSLFLPLSLSPAFTAYTALGCT